jgi:hypothetical protein
VFDLTPHRRRKSRWVTLVTLLAVIGLLSAASPVAIAQEGTPEAGTAPEVVEEPAASQEPPAAPAEETVDPPVGEEPEPAVEAPAAETVVPDEAAEPTVPPTPIITPTLVYAASTQPTCALAPDQTGQVASGGSIDYICTDRVAISGTDIAPASVGVTWYLSAAIDGGWTMQVLPPTNDPSVTPEWTPAGLAESHVEFAQINPVGAGTEPAAIDTAATINFRMRLHRPVCQMTMPTLWLNHGAVVSASDPATVITDVTDGYETVLLTPGLAPVPDPSVAFDGPLTFGEIALTADGPETTTKQGTISMTVANLDQACGAWTLAASATPLTDDAGVPLDGSQLVVVSVDGSPLAEGCDLTAGCEIAALTGGPDAPTSKRITLGVELRMPEQPGLGTFDTSLTAALYPPAAD